MGRCKKDRQPVKVKGHTGVRDEARFRRYVDSMRDLHVHVVRMVGQPRGSSHPGQPSARVIGHHAILEVFHRHRPAPHNTCLTHSGTPARISLLRSHTEIIDNRAC